MILNQNKQCFRMYSQNEYDHMNQFPIPEILKCPLEPILLQIIALNLESDPRNFQFIEQPTTSNMDNAITRLLNLGAVQSYTDSCEDDAFYVTELGKILAILPVDIVLGKMLVLGSVKTTYKDN